MKALAIFLVIVLLAAIVGVGYLYFNSNLEISFASVAAVDPVTQQDAFSQLKSSLEAGTFIGTRYDASPLTTPDNYLWYTWTLHLENKSFLKADILRYGDTAEYTLDSRMKNDLSVTMLTSRNMHSVREAIVTWYVWGLPFSTRLTLGK